MIITFQINKLGDECAVIIILKKNFKTVSPTAMDFFAKMFTLQVFLSYVVAVSCITIFYHFDQVLDNRELQAIVD